MEAVVEYDYLAKEIDELTIKKGDVIKNILDRGGGWCEGTLGDKRGMFPDNFVRMLNKDSEVVLRHKKDISRIRQCRVLFSYQQKHEDELNLDVDDLVEVIGEEEEGWWRGVLNGKQGVFPSNFVEEIIIGNKHSRSSKESLDNISDDSNSKTPQLPPKPGKILCEAKYSYKAQNIDELSFEEGELITLISKDGQDPGWWKGEFNGIIGVFPDNFVTILPSPEELHHSKEEKRTEKAATEATPKRQNRIEKHEGESANKITPPIPGKKPMLPIKKSPSSSSSTGGLLSGLKKKIVDAVDGGASSKSYNLSHSKSAVSEHTLGENAFDQVERNAMLSDVRATRAKAPGRRPPSAVFKDGEPGVVNGSSEVLSYEVLENTTQTETTEVKPKVREWVKHKAPWLEEMKLNQAKRTSTSPGPEQNKLKLTPDKMEDDKNSKVSPSETPNTIDMSKSMPSLNTKPKTAHNEQEINEKSPVLRSKPLNNVSARPQTIHSTPVNSVSDLGTPVAAPKVSPVINHKLVSPPVKPPVSEKNFEKASGDSTNEAIPPKKFVELLQRIEKLEAIVEKHEKQNVAYRALIEELRGKLQVETDMRILLQAELDKVSQCVMQV